MKFLGFGLATILAVVIALFGLSALSNLSNSIDNNVFLQMNWKEIVISMPISIAILLAAISFLGKGSETLWNFAAIISWFLFLLTFMRGLYSLNHYFFVACLLGVGVLAAAHSSIRTEKNDQAGVAVMALLFFFATGGSIAIMVIW
ncbi:MAG: hypothetical protein ACOYL8_02285 [Patescibacteria group bacterium]